MIQSEEKKIYKMKKAYGTHRTLSNKQVYTKEKQREKKKRGTENMFK
jgi:hypothetical protein